MSHFAKRFTGLSGIVSLMEDLGEALNENPDSIFMGGGNPASIAEVEQRVALHLQAIAQHQQHLHKLIGEYQPPQGDPDFLLIMAEFLNERYGWPVTEQHIAVSNGGQSAFFTLFNMLAGDNRANDNKSILLPMVPDYLGYADAGIDDDMFIGCAPLIQALDDNLFKYAVDCDQLAVDNTIAALCLSRPTNPSGNIVTDSELATLKALCRGQGIPLMIDAAYGKPFPGVTFVDHELSWDEDTILILSLSKLGLPGVRTGIVIAHTDIIKQFSRATASLSLSPGNFGPTLCKSLLLSGDLADLSHSVIHPFYQQKMQQTFTYLSQKFQGTAVKIHRPEGAFFVWLWFQDLPISSQQLYERLKQKGVLVLSGHHFFQALGDKQWRHQYECLRVSYCQPWEKVKQGIDILTEEVSQIYDSFKNSRSE